VVFTVTSGLDIRRSAWLMIRQHREHAALWASSRADELMAQGDMDGYVVWRRVLAEIERIQEQTMKPGRVESLH